MAYLLYQGTASAVTQASFMDEAAALETIRFGGLASGETLANIANGVTIDRTKQVESITLNVDGVITDIDYKEYHRDFSNFRDDVTNLYYTALESGRAVWNAPENARYLNWQYWLESMAAVGYTLADTTDATFNTDAVKANFLSAAHALMPGTRYNQYTWYTAHHEGVWTAYRALIGTNADHIQAYFGWSNGDTQPTFASDANTATAWDGSTGTLNVRIRKDRRVFNGDFLYTG